MGFVTFPEITHILFVGHIGFGDQGNRHVLNINQATQNSHYHMRFWQTHAGRAQPFPKVGDGIQTNVGSAHLGIKEKRIHKLQQYLWVRKVHVNLIVAECCPHPPDTTARMHFREQRGVSRTHTSFKSELSSISKK